MGDDERSMREDASQVKKKIDEAWKESITKEKTTGSDTQAELPEASFGLFITGLMMEALVALGDMENPATKKKESNLTHARFVIDTLAMLQDKTKNNLTKEEADALDSIIYDLRMRFVAKTKG